MAKVIALRFDNVKEVSTVKTLIEIGLLDPEVSPQDSVRGREIIKQLNKCAEMFIEKQKAEAADMDMESTENKRFAGSKQDYITVDDAGVNTATGQYEQGSANCEVCDD
jgi:hypothetical protein|tara:strand:- start:227 stop:553 length:327 start_codon:yes stop_codon:yes gene_type:complete